MIVTKPFLPVWLTTPRQNYSKGSTFPAVSKRPLGALDRIWEAMCCCKGKWRVGHPLKHPTLLKSGQSMVTWPTARKAALGFLPLDFHYIITLANSDSPSSEFYENSCHSSQTSHLRCPRSWLLLLSTCCDSVEPLRINNHIIYQPHTCSELRQLSDINRMCKRQLVY